MTIKKIALATAISTIFSNQTLAGSEIESLIKILHANGTVDDAQFGRLMDEIRVNQESKAVEKKQLQAQLDEANEVKIKVNKGGIQSPTSTLRFSSNYVNVLDVDGGENDGEEPSLVQVRGQWAF